MGSASWKLSTTKCKNVKMTKRRTNQPPAEGGHHVQSSIIERYVVPVPVTRPARRRSISFVLTQRRARLAQFVQKMLRAQCTTTPVINTSLQTNTCHKCQTKPISELTYTINHTMLPATQHRWTQSTLTPARQNGTRFTYPRWLETWVTRWLVIYRDRLPVWTSGLDTRQLHYQTQSVNH